MEMCWKCARSQANPDVDESVSSSDLEKCSISSVSAMDALQWMGAVRIQTADKNISIIHTTPVHQLTSSEDKSWKIN